jgi:hypothetical protein
VKYCHAKVSKLYKNLFKKMSTFNFYEVEISSSKNSNVNSLPLLSSSQTSALKLVKLKAHGNDENYFARSGRKNKRESSFAEWCNKQFYVQTLKFYFYRNYHRFYFFLKPCKHTHSLVHQRRHLFDCDCGGSRVRETQKSLF